MSTDHEAIVCSCGSRERRPVRRARLTESDDGRITVVRGCPAELCLGCGEVGFPPAVAERADELAMSIAAAGADVAVVRWEDGSR